VLLLKMHSRACDGGGLSRNAMKSMPTARTPIPSRTAQIKFQPALRPISESGDQEGSVNVSRRVYAAQGRGSSQSKILDLRQASADVGLADAAHSGEPDDGALLRGFFDAFDPESRRTRCKCHLTKVWFRLVRVRGRWFGNYKGL
jgi:hypothetical protein